MAVISAVIPVWNRAHLVGRAIASVLAQQVPGWSVEVIVVDDGSSDGLDDALAAFGERVSCVRHERNRGAAAARNTGIAAARGTHVAFLDSDDAWLPGKLVAQIGFMQAQGYRASCTAYLLKRANAAEFVSPRYATGTLALSDLAWGCFVSPGATLVCRRDTLAEIGPLDEDLPRLEDWDWLFRYVKVHPLGFLAEPFARVEVAPGRDVGKDFDAIARMQARHASSLPPRERRHFEAALHLMRAAAHYRSGRALASAAELARSWCRAPAGNVALAALLHNRLARG